MFVKDANLQQLNSIVEIHMDTFPGFFLTFMGSGFLKCMYKAYLKQGDSQLLVAVNEEGELLGFVASSNNISELYRYLLRQSTIPLAWYSFLAVLRRPTVVFRLIRGLLKPKQSERSEQYAELSSIGVSPQHKKIGVGSILIEQVKNRIDFSSAAYLKLETDADDNTDVNSFYLRNGFVLHHVYTTSEGRRMNEYRYTPYKS